MTLPILKLKTEYVPLSSSANYSNFTLKPIQIATSKITSTSATRNIGIVFDDREDIGKQIANACQTCFSWLRYIRQIRHCLIFDATQTLVQALVLSRLHYCNSIYYGLPEYQIAKGAIFSCPSHHPGALAANFLFSSKYSILNFCDFSQVKFAVYWSKVFTPVKHSTLLARYFTAGSPIIGHVTCVEVPSLFQLPSGRRYINNSTLTP